MHRLGITGGSGFIGRRLNARLAALGRDRDVLQIGRTDPGVGRFARFDLDAAGNEPLPAIDCLAHVAAFVPDDQHAADPLACERANGGGMLRLLEALDLQTLGRVVHAGSFHVWDAARPAHVTNAYEASKLSARMLLRAHARRHDFEWTSLGLPYVYGPGMVHGKMFRVFAERARAGEPIELERDGRDPLHLLYVDDAVEAILAAVDAAAGAGEVDIVPEETVTVAEIAASIVDLTGSASEIRLLAGEPFPARPHDGAPARERLGFRPRTGLREGLAALLDAGFGEA